MELLSTRKLLENGTSFPESGFPSYRKKFGNFLDDWISGKMLDDGAEGYWRIYDKLYDFSTFLDHHPGGRSWLTLTKGTDITEQFESHHISLLPENMLSKYYVKEAEKPRNSPFTFKEDGFYKILKANVREELKTMDIKKHAKESEVVMDLLLLSLAVCLVIASSGEWNFIRWTFCLISSLVMAWTINCAHNFVHKKDNWRMNFVGLLFSSVRIWRVVHAFSHHMFPNTLWDLEMYVFEPLFIWMPRKGKSFTVKYLSKFYAIIIYLIMGSGQSMRYLFMLKNKHLSKFEWDDLIAFTVPIFIYVFGTRDIKQVLLTWVIIWHLTGIIQGVVNLHAAHHHPEIFHDGDIAKRDRDWGLFQLDAVADRIEINSSFFMVMTHFGEHTLHHLFPTLDHSILAKLQPVFAKTCQKFRVKIRMTNQLEMFLGYYKQLAKTEPKDFNLQEDDVIK